MRSKDKPSKQRLGHANAANPNSYLNIIFIELVTRTINEKPFKPTIQTFKFFSFLFEKNLVFIPTSTSLRISI